MSTATALFIDGVGKYDLLKIAHTAAVTKGDVLKTVNTSRVLVALETYAANVAGLFVYEGRIQAPKAAVAITAGDAAYWDDTAKLFTNTSNAGANTKCGIFFESALSGDANAVLDLENTPNL